MSSPHKLVDLRPVVEAVPSLRLAASWTLAASVIYGAAQWGMLATVVKLSSAREVGQYALGISIAAPVFMLTNLQLRSVQATDARCGYNFADYFTLRCLGTVAGVVLIFLIVVCARFDRATGDIVMAVAAAKAIEQLSDVIAGLLQKFERLDQAARAQMLRGVASIALFALVLLTSHRLAAAVLASGVACAIALLTYDRRLARHLLEQEHFLGWNPRKLKQLALMTLPLGIVTALIALNVNIPRYVVQRYLGPVQLGIFVSVAYLLVATVNVITNSVGLSASARLARMFAAGDLAGFNRVMRKLALFGVCIGAITVPAAFFFGGPVLELLYRPEYDDYGKLLAIMAAIASVSAVGSFLTFGLTAARQFLSQVPVIAAATFAAFAAAVLLVPAYGLDGAAVALLISATVLVLGSGAALALAESKVSDRKCEAVRPPTNAVSASEAIFLGAQEKD
jgi:O-antigen/teichoic acid export membrane protein